MAAAARPPTTMPAIAPVDKPLLPPVVLVPFALSAAPAAVPDDDDEVERRLLGVDVGVMVVKAVTTTTPSLDVPDPGRVGGLGGDGREGVDDDVDVLEVDVEVEVVVDVVEGVEVLKESE